MEGNNTMDELRDKFAKAALTGILARNNTTLLDEIIIAKKAYAIADAMLRVRKPLEIT